MNYHVLKLFYYVAITGSVTKASERLHISQPAISAQIRKFERENHILLFEIKGKRMVPTPLGKRLIEPLEKFLPWVIKSSKSLKTITNFLRESADCR